MILNGRPRRALARLLGRGDPVSPPQPPGVGPPGSSAVVSGNIDDVLNPDGSPKAAPSRPADS